MPTMHTLTDGTKRLEYTVKETAQLIRAALKTAFPGVTFSVRTQYASCYGATNVSWTDGPTEPEVRLVTDRFTSQGFDGMTDSTTYHEQVVDGQRVKFAGWVNTSRHISDELRQLAERQAAVLGVENVWTVLRVLRPNGCRVMLKGSAHV